MGMDVYVLNDADEANLKSSSNSLLAACNGENGMLATDGFTKMLTMLEIDLAYSSEKLVNLDYYMTILSLQDDRLDELSKDEISEVEIEKALIFDLLFGYLHSEVTELAHILSVLRKQIAGVHQKTDTSERLSEESYAAPQKLIGFSSSWKDLQEKVSEMKHQLVDLHRTLSAIEPNSLYSFEDENSEGSGVEFGQRRLVLEMLEKSLATELDLKKQLLESKQREEDQKLKILLTNEVVSKLETFTEITLGRLLEAEYSSEMFMRFAKEMMFRFQILQFNLQCSVHREGELKSELMKKEHALAEVQRKYDKLRLSSQDKETLDEKVKLLEKKLRRSESKLQEASEFYEGSQEQLSLMEEVIESLREQVFMAESRAQTAETELSALTEENMELREEVGFLKVGDGNEEKTALLEKQVRDLEAQLQTARGASDMLYTAIWDMETLIEELKSKVSKSESRAENAEEQCLALAESNLELTKEITLLKSKSEKVEESLKEDNRAKLAWSKDINDGAKLVTEMVMQLATERERIQKQLSSLARENKILSQELRKMRKNSSFKVNQGYREYEMKESGSTSISRVASASKDFGETPTSATTSNLVDDSLEQNTIDDVEAAGSSTSDNATTADFLSCENQGRGKNKYLNKKLVIFAAIFVLVLSVLAVNISWQDLHWPRMTKQYRGTKYKSQMDPDYIGCGE